MKIKDKNGKEKYVSLPNEFHREQRWAGARVTRNKKKYTRKTKHKGRMFD